jgi:hypothetical protein
LAALGARPAATAEVRLFTAMSRSARQLGEDWPSAFRNAINYRPGFAYTAVRRTNVLQSLNYLRKPSTYEVAEVLDRFESNLALARGRTPILSSTQAVLELLIDLTFLIHAITTELHSELLERHRLDVRWRGSRHRFLRTANLYTDDSVWPL